MPQVDAAVAAHWVATTGAAPAEMLLQVPLLLVSAHDLHVPVQLLAQQTPCWQKPELHSFPAVHRSPRGCLVQMPPLQMFGATQSASAVQVILQDWLVASH